MTVHRRVNNPSMMGTMCSGRPRTLVETCLPTLYSTTILATFSTIIVVTYRITTLAITYRITIIVLLASLSTITIAPLPLASLTLRTNSTTTLLLSTATLSLIRISRLNSHPTTFIGTNSKNLITRINNLDSLYYVQII